MNVMGQVLVLFLLILSGFIAVKTKSINEAGVRGLNAFVVNFALPGMAIAKLQQEASSELMLDLAYVAILTVVSMLAFGAIIWFGLCRRAPRPQRASMTGMAMLTNIGFIGLPIMSAALGDDKLIYGIIYAGVSNLVIWSIGVMIYDRSAWNWKRMFLIPTLIASIIGLILFVAGIRLPDVLFETLDMLGQTTTPLAMFIIGTRLTELRLRDMCDAKLLLLCALRLIVFPLAIYGLCQILGVSEWVRSSVMLATAMPCGTALVIQAENYHGDVALTSRGVAISTLLCVATIPLLLLLV